MTRSLKVLGLAMAAVFAFAAISAASASAAEFTSFNTTTGAHESGGLVGDQTTTHQFVAAVGGDVGTCVLAHFESSSTTGTEATPVITPTYTDCHSVKLGTTYKIHVTTNGCKYQFHVASGSADKWTGTWSIVGCNAGQKIDLKITKPGTEETRCTIRIGEQTGLNNITFENNTAASPTDLIATTQTNNIISETEGGLLGCGIGNGVHTAGTYTGSTTIKGFNTGGTQIDLTVM